MTEWLIDGRYRVAERIGSGGMADVFRAHDVVLARDVAVKVFRTLPEQPDTALGVERQRIELHALATLNHPNLVTLYDGSVTAAPAYLVLELIDGPPLSELLAHGSLPEPQVRSLGIQMGDALAYVHAHQMVHRDVKPANILLGKDPRVLDEAPRARLSDFGIVRIAGTDRMTSVNLTVGSACYLAPEQARGHQVGPAADIYSLGLVLIEAFTGIRAYQGAPLEAMTARLSHGPTIPTTLPDPWRRLLTDMTAMNPADRPSAAAVAHALRTARTEPARPVPTAAPAETTALLASVAAPPVVAQAVAGDAEPRGHRLGLVAAALTVICVGGAAVLVRTIAFSGSPPHAPSVPQQSVAAVPSNVSSGRASQPVVLKVGSTAPVHRAPATPRPTASSRSHPRGSSEASSPARTPASTSPSTAPTTSSTTSSSASPPSSSASSPIRSGSVRPDATRGPPARN